MMKELPPLRFLAIWLWLVLLAAAPVLFGIAKDRKSTRLNSSHQIISYAVFCLKKKKRSNDFHFHPANRRKAGNQSLTMRFQILIAARCHLIAFAFCFGIRAFRIDAFFF